ncbi:MAG: hypothetical protein GX989_04610 [Firmicutes bacterium]|nr:hypothetical protein [Bacillota bacterium]
MLENPVLIFAAICLPVSTVYLLAPYFLRLQKFKKITALNFRGAIIINAGGLLLFAALLSVQILHYLYLPKNFFANWPVLLYWGGVTLLGLLDDLHGEKKCKGFRGHLLKFWRGEGISTGLYKAAGGLLLGILISAWIGGGGTRLEWLCRGIFLALFSNLFNLMDTRPARSAKFFFLVSLIFVLIYRDLPLPLISLWSALYIYLFWELEQKIMLGDTGAYLLGVVLGLYLVLRLPLNVLFILIGLLLVLHYLGERFSWNVFLENNKLLLPRQFPGGKN